MKYADLQPGDMFNTISFRYVKQLDGSAIVVSSKYAGETVDFKDDEDVIPLYVAKERVSLRSIIEAAEELSSAIWAKEELPDEFQIRPRLEKLDNEIEKAKKGIQ